MPACCVPNCSNGYNYKKDVEAAAGRGVTLSFFQVKQSQVESWNHAIPRADRKIKTSDYVCSEHFYESQIKRFDDDIIIDGKVIERGRKLRQPRLAPDAVPKIFKGPAYLTKPEAKKRSSRERSSSPLPTKRAHSSKNEMSDTISPSDVQQQNVSLQDILKTNLMNKINQASLVHNADSNETEPQAQTSESDSNIETNTNSTPSNPKMNNDKIDVKSVKLPGYGWGLHSYPNTNFFVKISDRGIMTHNVHISEENKLSLKIRGCPYPYPSKIACNRDIENALFFADKLKVCEGNGYTGHSEKCKGGVKMGVRCSACRASHKNERKKEKRALTNRNKMRKKMSVKRSKKLYYLRKQNEGYKKREKSLKAELRAMCKKNAMLEKNQVEEKIKDLPPAQQLAVMACLDAAKRQDPHGNRFHVEWVYECLLMRIKSPALYEHLREKEILVLPCRATLNRYMRKLKPVYGFQSVLFDVLKHKISGWDEVDLHGSILIDEMKIPSELDFDRHTLRTIGLVDIGDHTPEEDKTKAGDHVLVILFRPYRGDWVQTLGAFLSKGNVKGPILAKLILESIGLVEGAGLKVDGVATDAAKWNRNMWDEFGIDENNCSCEHPRDEERRLFFFSDWSHLVKCARNCWCPEMPQKPKPEPKRKPRKRYNESGKEMTPQEVYEQKVHDALNKEVEVPEGTVKRQHWIALLKEEEDLAARQGVAALTYVPGLSKKIVFPDGFERMNVAMARKFFSNSVRAGFEFYRTHGAVPALEDSEPTEKFIERFNELCDVMNSHGPKDAVRADNGKLEIISDYLKYHAECVNLAKSKGKAFFSKETDLGITVTLKSTIGLSEYLLKTVGFKYVMTARFNSDPIEQFFSKIRAAGKANPHPNPKTFIQLYRLLCVYSLVKPPKGSNCEGGENVKNLLNAEDSLEAMEKERKAEIDEMLDEIVGHGEVLAESYPIVTMMDHSYLPSPEMCEENLVSFMSGFSAFQQKKLANNCNDCLLTFSKPREEAGSTFAFTRIKEIYMGYTYPSDELRRLISAVETAVRESLNNHGIQTDIFQMTLKYIKLDPSSDHVGCIQHKEEVTKKMIVFYLTMRMFFATGRKNEEIQVELKKKESKKLVKTSRLL